MPESIMKRETTSLPIVNQHYSKVNKKLLSRKYQKENKCINMSAINLHSKLSIHSVNKSCEKPRNGKN